MRAGIALGANLGDRRASLRAAREAVIALPEAHEPVRCSRIYETEAVGMEPGAAAFLNAVIEIEWCGTPLALLTDLQAIEARMGRPSKRPRNAPRAIDLDVLYVGDLTLAGDDFTLPHPRLHERRFVLQPLCDIRPELLLPGFREPASSLLARLGDDGERVDVFAETWEP